MRNFISQTYQLLFFYRLRFFLALITLLIGFAALIALLTIKFNIYKQIDELVGDVAPELISIQFIAPKEEQTKLMAWFGTEQYSSWKENFPSPFTLHPYLIGNQSFEYQHHWYSVVGVDSGFFTTLDLNTKLGRPFYTFDSHKNIAVLGNHVYQALNTQGVQLHDWIKIADKFYQIVGVLDKKEGIPFLDFEINRSVFIGVKLLSLQENKTYLDTFITRLDKGLTSSIIKNTFAPFLPNTRFFMRDTGQMRNKLQKSKETILQVLTFFAAITLFVGIVSMLNVWLIILQERRGEIGLRRLLGANIQTIMLQFGFEAVTLSTFAAIGGVGLGLTVAYIIAGYLQVTFLINGYNILQLFIVSSLFGMALALMSGYFARKTVYMRFK